jgi:hypothetical protein
MKHLAYYAHSKLSYGMPREKDELAFLEQSYRVICPNRDIGERGEMEPYLTAVRLCQETIISPFLLPSGQVRARIGKGCYHEVAMALALGRSTYCLLPTKTSFKLVVVRGICTFDTTDWKQTYAEVII